MDKVIKEIKDTHTALVAAVSSIDKNKFNTIPFKDSWTAAQVSEHILKAIGVGVLYGDTKATDRNPDIKIQQTADLFLNMGIKMQSPDFIFPSGDEHAKDEILADIENTFQKLLQASQTLDLSATCVGFEIPGFGEFTRLEFIYFFMFHTQRHTNQLKNIASALAT